ncbi:uncharacterized protein PGRI_056050 [Penicillium griseofulvum]|uniref:Septin-type G domain-containing protein n=1 Tax=Penicillium patulum TaxID=5078 RepID=A0A135LKZ2_PENPA|nr:uncharacterized protein PGRI_056050 [Penicillium griseofulvum]KXG49637.1 hypothetical protein PGRI_056050 [Penicillium griseofulvum]
MSTSETASPIGIANLPNQRHKIVAKRGAAFTIMVAGESGLGKTTFINTLFSTTIKNYADHKRRHQKQVDRTVEIEITKAELEEKFFKVRLTVIDTPGFGDYVNNRDSWQPIIEFLDDQHESYMLQEQQPRRTDKIDMRVHACLYFIRPTGHTLKPLDIEVMKRLSSRVNLIPVVAKADTLSHADLVRYKDRIRAVIEAQGIKIYSPPVEEDDEHAASHARSLMAAMPFAVIGSEKDVKANDGRVVKGRQYAWGVAEVENEDHCDFKKLRSILIRTHMLDLIHTTEESHYEAYRAQQMETRKFGEARPRKLDNPKFKEEEETLRKRFTEQVKVEEQRFRQWEQKLISERDRLNKDLEATHAAIKSLEQEIEGPVNAVTFSSSGGTYVLTGSTDRAIHLSRAIPNSNSTTAVETTTPIQKYEAHGYSVLDIAVAADNARFASVGGDRQVFLWDVEQGITTKRWSGHNNRVEAVQFAGDGDSVVVTGSADTTINLWDTRSSSYKPIQTLTDATDTVSSLHVHMGSYSIASGSYDGRARIYDVRTGKTTVDVLAQAVTSVRCSSDGNALLVSTLGGNIRMLDRMDGKVLNSFGGEKGGKSRYSYRNSELRVRSVFAMGDAVVLSGSEEGGGDGGKGAAAFAWDVVKGEVIAAVPVGEKVKAVSCVAWNEGVGDWAAGCTDGKDFGVFEGWISADCCLKVPSESMDEVGPFPDVSDKAVMIGLVSRLVSTSSIAGFELPCATLFHRQNRREYGAL